MNDLKFAFRQLVKNPGFTAVAVLTLALGIGANTAIFSVFNAVLLRALPFKEPDRLMTVSERNLKKLDGEKSVVGSANFTDWKRQSQSFDALAAYMNWNYNLTGDGEPQRLGAVLVTGEFFRALGVQAALGRALAPDDDQEGRDNVVVLSHAFWQSRFGARREIVGQPVTLNNNKHTVVGVMPAGFEFPDASTELWRPMAMSAELTQNRQGKWLRVIGRLKAGVTLAQADPEMQTIAGRLAQQYPESNADWSVTLTPLHEEVVGNVRSLIFILLSAVGFVLLIACANVANLLLARAGSRQKEMAVRAALGASRGRLLRQFLSESLLLAVLGGAIGLLLARWCSEALIALSPGNVPRLNETTLDARVLGFTLMLSLLTTLIFGLIPAWPASKPDLNETLKVEGRGAVGDAGRRLRSALVVAEVAIGVVVLMGAGLAVRSFLKLQQVNTGFNPRNLLTLQIMLPASKYSQNHQQIAFLQQTLEKIKATPGVQSVGAVQDLPLRLNATSFPITLVGRPAVAEKDRPMAAYRAVTDDYFRTMGIPLLQGRAFTPQDDLNASPVVIVNQTMVRRLWPDDDPLGKQIRFGEPNDPAYTIVGVVGDIKHMGLAGDEGAALYQPHAQKRFAWLRWMAVVVRTQVEPLALAAAVRSRVQEVDHDQPVYDITTMEQLLAKSVAEPRFTTLLLSGFALLALGLASLGVYGIVSFAVVKRTHEIGIRMALGAEKRDVLKLVVGQGMRLVLLGVGIGLVAALGLSRVLQTLLFEVKPTDPLTFSVIPLLLAAVALFACWLPARRAARVDPMEALRYE